MIQLEDLCHKKEIPGTFESREFLFHVVNFRNFHFHTIYLWDWLLFDFPSCHPHPNPTINETDRSVHFHVHLAEQDRVVTKHSHLPVGTMVAQHISKLGIQIA